MLDVADELVSAARQAGDKTRELWGHDHRLMANLTLGNIVAVDEEIEAISRLAEEIRQPLYQWEAAMRRPMRAMMEGRFADAEQLALQALAIGQRTGEQNPMIMFGAQMSSIRSEQGRLSELEAQARASVELFPGLPVYRASLAVYYERLDRAEDARAEFEICARDEFALFPLDANLPIALTLLASVCTYLGDSARAAVLYDKLLPYEGQAVMVGPAALCTGAASMSLGNLAATMSRWNEAERHFEDALAMNARMGHRPALAWSHHSYAGMLLGRGADGDREKAFGHIGAALDTAQELGMKALTERALKLKLQLQGVDLTDIGTSIDTVAREALAEHPDLKPHAAPDGTVTIMFSDIEGSTVMADRLGDTRFMEVLREHNAIVRDQIKANAGFEVKSEGDGFMVAFQSARKGLECAVGIQRALEVRNREPRALTPDPSPVRGRGEKQTPDPSTTEDRSRAAAGEGSEVVRVRIGLHAGEVIKEGEDFFGRNVIMAARVASQAHGGEILASGVLKALLEGSDVAWGDKRAVELKGLPGEHEIWAVEWSE
jgi:class 3 adenylate cyclase